jgi:hypothetical protein
MGKGDDERRSCGCTRARASDWAARNPTKKIRRTSVDTSSARRQNCGNFGGRCTGYADVRDRRSPDVARRQKGERGGSCAIGRRSYCGECLRAVGGEVDRA